jgi:dienelactone hydrolase
MLPSEGHRPVSQRESVDFAGPLSFIGGMKYFLLGLTLLGPASAQAQTESGPVANTSTVRWVEREFMMPAPGAPVGLDVLQVEVERPGKHPLAILTHGTSDDAMERAKVSPGVFLPQAIWFARRGFVVLVVVRKGYGRSSGDQDGKHGGCQRAGGGSFAEAGEASADDLRAAAKYAATLPEVDAGTIVSAGVSTGGFAQVALTANPPVGLKAAISFAGGRGGDGKEHNCDIDGIVSAFRHFGKKSRTPMLWIYSENDHWFPPDVARKFEAAFREGGGMDQFVMVPPYREDGHTFYYNITGWTPLVEDFLKGQNLLSEAELLPPPPVPEVPPPTGLTDRGIAAFHNFLIMGPHKAFATNGSEIWGVSFGQFDQELADKKALENCTKQLHGSGKCSIVAHTK